LIHRAPALRGPQSGRISAGSLADIFDKSQLQLQFPQTTATSIHTYTYTVDLEGHLDINTSLHMDSMNLEEFRKDNLTENKSSKENNSYINYNNNK
jgi:hypothetical protein